MLQRREAPRQRSEAPAMAGDALLGEARALQDGRRGAEGVRRGRAEAPARVVRGAAPAAQAQGRVDLENLYLHHQGHTCLSLRLMCRHVAIKIDMPIFFSCFYDIFILIHLFFCDTY